jgi:hypothetical protein
MDETEAVALSTVTAYRDLQDQITTTITALHLRAAEAHAAYVQARDNPPPLSMGIDAYHGHQMVVAQRQATWAQVESDYQLVKGMLG